MKTPNQLDLIDYLDGKYPYGPGHRRPETSKDATKAIRSRAENLRESILGILRAGPELTADEMAEILGVTVLSCRPRVTELSRQGKIVPTGERRKNQSGMTAMVYKIGSGLPRWD